MGCHGQGYTADFPCLKRGHIDGGKLTLLAVEADFAAVHGDIGIVVNDGRGALEESFYPVIVVIKKRAIGDDKTNRTRCLSTFFDEPSISNIGSVPYSGLAFV